MVFKSPFEEVEPEARFKGLVSNFFWHQLDVFAANTLLLDYQSGREWTGAATKRASARLALGLLERCRLGPNFDCVSFYPNCDHLQLAALAVLFAGGSLCAGAPEDPEQEHAYMLEVIRPQLVLTQLRLVAEMLRIWARSARAPHTPLHIVVMDDAEAEPDGDPDHQHRDQDQDQDQMGRRHSFGRLAEEARANNVQLHGFHKHLLSDRRAPTEARLPVQVDPERAAFVLLTSGSTGRPKPVGRSQRNSLWVCHSLSGLAGARLWNLHERSVLAGHLQLDHGTGTFCLKMCLTKGLKLVLMHGYEYARMLAAIRRFQISDLCLGSALLHNFIESALDSPTSAADSSSLGSLRNILAVGSPIASQQLVERFMARFGQCSVRPAYGMTECGFVAITAPAEVGGESEGGGGGGGDKPTTTTRTTTTTTTTTRAPEDEDEDEDELLGALGGARPVGCLLPNLRVKLIARTGDQAGQEISALRSEGELLVSGPTVSPGYLGGEFQAQSLASFLPDGFYKTNDICQLLPGGRLLVRGRYSEVLCLYDGWKVLPDEIERELLAHPLIGSAAVIGIPHPRLPTCHAARAYVTPREGVAGEFEPEFERALARAQGRGQQARAQLPDDDDHHEREHEHQHDEHAGQPAAPTGPLLTAAMVREHAVGRLSEPKHLTGGVRILRQLPRISIGKVDKKLLRRLDGYL